MIGSIYFVKRIGTHLFACTLRKDIEAYDAFMFARTKNDWYFWRTINNVMKSYPIKDNEFIKVYKISPEAYFVDHGDSVYEKDIEIKNSIAKIYHEHTKSYY